VDLCHGEQARWDVLTALRQAAATCQIPVILVSTSNLKHSLERAEAEHALWGGDRYLLKPFNLARLYATPTSPETR
jgi:CheY-like chemotaxis protein